MVFKIWTARNIYASWTIFWTQTLFFLKIEIEDWKEMNFSFVVVFDWDNLWKKKTFILGDCTYLIRNRVNNVTIMISTSSTCLPSKKSPRVIRNIRAILMIALIINFMLIIFFPTSPFSDCTLTSVSNKFENNFCFNLKFSSYIWCCFIGFSVKL